MRFFNRKKESEKLLSLQQQSLQDCSRMTVLIGRRRIGKTMLIRHTFTPDDMLYLFVARKSEAELVNSFTIQIREKGWYIPDGMTQFSQLFKHLLELGKNQPFTLAIDEFQEFDNINPSVFSDMQNLWDSYKEHTHINLVVSGSAYRLMQKIFMDKDEPLFNRADAIIRLQPFTIDVLKHILSEYHPQYSNDDLLALYAITGGVPKYVAWQEIANGSTTQAQIETKLGGISIGGYLKQLEQTYTLIRRIRPILSKPQSKAVQFVLCDPFLRFWFRHVEKYRSLVELQNFDGLLQLAQANYTSYSGMVLEDYFRQQMAQTGQWREIGCWWQAKAIEYHGRQIDAEVDIVALSLTGHKALAVEVKRQRSEYDHELFMAKVQYLKQKDLHSYTISTQLLTLEDM